MGKLRWEVRVSSSRFHSEEIFSLLVAARRGFSRLTKRLKRKEWANFCEEANNVTTSTRRPGMGSNQR